MSALALIPLQDIPLIRQGDDLADMILSALELSSIAIKDGDILVLTQKIVSKAEGQMINLTSVTPSQRAIELAGQIEKDPRLVELMLQESKAVLRTRPGTIIVEHRLGFICANAGIDHSNVAGDGTAKEEYVLLLPRNPDQSARENGPNIPFTVPAAGYTVTFSYNPTSHVLTISLASPVSQPDNNVEWDGLRHDSRDLLYRTPGGAVPAGTPVIIRFRTFHNDVTGVGLRVYDINAGAQKVLPMTLAASDVGCYQDGLEYHIAVISGRSRSTRPRPTTCGIASLSPTARIPTTMPIILLPWMAGSARQAMSPWIRAMPSCSTIPSSVPPTGPAAPASTRSSPTVSAMKDILLPDRFDNLEAFGITDEQEADLRGVNASAPAASVVLADGLTRLKSMYVDADTTEFHLIIKSTPDNNVPPAEVLTPSDWGEMYLVVHAEGKLTLPGVLLEGTFDLEINEQFAVMVAYVSLKVEFGTAPFAVTLIDLDAVGVIKINEEGIAGKLKLNLASGGKVPFSQMGIDGFELDSSASIDLLLHTTKKESRILLPDKFDPYASFQRAGWNGSVNRIPAG